MFNKFMDQKELNVKVGDRVVVQGNRGIVTEVFHGIKTEWNGEKYVEIPGTESTAVRVHFEGNLASWGQYQDGVYGGFAIIDDIEKWKGYV